MHICCLLRMQLQFVCILWRTSIAFAIQFRWPKFHQLCVRFLISWWMTSTWPIQYSYHVNHKHRHHRCTYVLAIPFHIDCITSIYDSYHHRVHTLSFVGWILWLDCNPSFLLTKNENTFIAKNSSTGICSRLIEITSANINN